MNLHAFYIILILVAGGLGYYLGTLPQPSTTPSDLQAARDSLKAQTQESITREQWHVSRYQQDSIKIASLEAKEYSHQVKIHTYEKRLQDLRNIPVAHPDSFLIRRYPGPAPGGPVAPGDGGAGTHAEGPAGQFAYGEGQSYQYPQGDQHHKAEYDLFAERSDQ